MSTRHYPEPIQSDIDHAIEVLKSFGAREVYLFGSILRHSSSKPIGDIDIAVAGLPPEHFFRAYGTLLMELHMPFDLVDLDDDSEFVRALREDGQLEHVA